MALLQKAYLGAAPLFRNTSYFEGTSQKTLFEVLEAGVAADISPHVKGAWYEIIDSTPSDISLLVIEPYNVSLLGLDTSTLLDIGIGASGSETPLIQNIGIGGASVFVSTGALMTFPIPIKIPSGTRISFRLQSAIDEHFAEFNVFGLNMNDYAAAPTSVDVLGTNTATSAGTAMSGASGTFVEVVASTSQAYRAVVLIASQSGNTAPTRSYVKFTLATGASGAEQEVGHTYAGYLSTERVFSYPRWPCLINGPIPSGSRLSVSHTFTSLPEAGAVTLIGIP